MKRWKTVGGEKRTQNRTSRSRFSPCGRIVNRNKLAAKRTNITNPARPAQRCNILKLFWKLKAILKIPAANERRSVQGLAHRSHLEGLFPRV